MKKVIIATLLFTMLHSCMGCSDSQSDMEPIPVPQEEYMASDMVIYEANPRIFAEENAFSAIKAELDRIQSLGTTVLWLMPVNEPGVLKSVNSPTLCLSKLSGLWLSYFYLQFDRSCRRFGCSTDS